MTDAVQHRQANWHSTSQLDRMMCALFVVFNLPPTALAVAVIPDDNYLWFFSLHKLFLWTSAHHIPNFQQVKVQTFDCDCKWQQSRSRSSLPSTESFSTDSSSTNSWQHQHQLTQHQDTSKHNKKSTQASCFSTHRLLRHHTQHQDQPDTNSTSHQCQYQPPLFFPCACCIGLNSFCI